MKLNIIRIGSSLLLCALLTVLLLACPVLPPPSPPVVPPDEDIVVQSIVAEPTGTIYVDAAAPDDTGTGAIDDPTKTIKRAVSLAQYGNLIQLAAGTYVEDQAIILPVGVSIQGSGVGTCTITHFGEILPPDGIDKNSQHYYLWRHGSLIQLASPTYSNGSGYGSPSEMLPATDGNQKLSGFTVNGNFKNIKAGIWVENRNNVTIEDVNFTFFKQRGLVVCRSDMWWYVPIPEGKWVRNIVLNNLSFTNCTMDIDNGSQSNSQSLGALSIGGINGAEISNITINENAGYGIKFMHVGHFRNVKIFDCNITVPTVDQYWGEDASIELWNLSWGNEVYNINSNTWFSFAAQAEMQAVLMPTAARPSNLKVHNVKIIHPAGTSSKEAIELMVSGAEVYNSYFKDKGFGIAIWDAGGHNVKIYNNVFHNTSVKTNWAGGVAVYIDNSTTRTYSNITIDNNVFDTYSTALTVGPNVDNVKIRNNVFLNTETHVSAFGTNVSASNNLSTVDFYNAGIVAKTNNITNADPEFMESGDRWDEWYRPASGTSPLVNQGIDVGLPFDGSSPDIGAFEWVE